VAPLLALLVLLGIVGGALRGQRTVLLVGLVVGSLLLAGAALIGIEWRYRFPLDPLVNTLAAGGLVLLAGLAQAGWRRLPLPPWRDRPTITRPAGTAS
jgi:hypothetical protein